MELAMLVYVVDSLLGSIKGFSVTIVIILGMYYIAVFVAVVSTSSYEKDTDTYKLLTKPRKWLLLPLSISILILLVVPSSNTAKYMVGAYFVQEVITSEKVGEVSNLAYKATMTQLNKWAETQPELKVFIEDLNKTNPSQGE